MTLGDRHNTPDAGAVAMEQETRSTPVTAPSPVVPDVGNRELTIQTTSEVDRRDRVRWGPVWAGLLVTLSTFVVLEVAFFALGWLTLEPNQPGSTAGWISGMIGLVAFFLGGVTAGLTAMWRDVTGGILHGMLVWALATVGIIFLTLLGGGALFGAVAEVFTQVTSLRTSNVTDVQLAQVAEAARSAAAWALLGLGLSFAAAAAGGAAAAKVWPHERNAAARTH